MRQAARRPQGIDAAVILNAYHEMKRGVVMLQHIRNALRPGAALVLCEPISDKPGQTRAEQMEDHVIYTQEVVDELQQAGFRVVEHQDAFATNLGGTRFGLVVARPP